LFLLFFSNVKARRVLDASCLCLPVAAAATGQFWPEKSCGDPSLYLWLSFPLGGTGEDSDGLGCAFRVVFRFLPGLIFRNPRNSAEFRQFRGTHVGIKSFQGKINLVQNPTESRIVARIPEGSAMCNEHSLRRHTQNRCQKWHSAVSAAAAITTHRKPLHRAASLLPLLD
jgi:hypothetical protein